jgi:hypothetical protein
MSIYDAEMPNIVVGTYGEAEVEYIDFEESYKLSYKGVPWMGTDKYFIAGKDLLHSQFDLAYGDVLLTGLGFGILAKALCQKPGVTSVTVIELNQDVIDAYLTHNELDEKMVIVKDDASHYTPDREFDCLLPDHYELQTLNWTIKDMNKIAERIGHKVFWPWSIEEIFLMKMYPKETYKQTSTKFLELYTAELPEKWREFIDTYFNKNSYLASISDDKLVEYVAKYAPYYYDRDIKQTDWAY